MDVVSWFNNNQALIQSIFTAALLAFSFQVALRSGVFTFAQVGFWGIGGYTAGRLALDGWSVVPAVATALIVCGLAGLLLGLVLARLRSLYLAMATVAFDLIVQSVASSLTSLTGGDVGLTAVPFSVSTLDVFVVVVLCALLLWRLERGASGRTLEAMRLDEDLGAAVGVDIFRARVAISGLSAVLAGLAGAMNIYLTSFLAPPQISFGLLTATLTMVVVGGVTSWVGALVGAALLTWLPTQLTGLGNWWPAIQAALVIIVLVFVPEGIVGIVQDGVRVLSRRYRRWTSRGPVLNLRP
jgi:ABC-type branched-subunit amino acid transport system permease subunit